MITHLAWRSSNASSESGTPASRNGGNASNQYQKLSQLEHILKRPDTYIGSVEKNEVEMWCFDDASELMMFKKVTIVPGLYKIFDEILVNAADNKIRDKSMKNIKVEIDAAANTILVMNDGKGIPVEIHDKENIWIPEMIFGNLLTSSNYDDDQKKVVGGRNGFGAKLCNIFSTEFELETSDQTTGQLYKQTWTQNMLKVSKPQITKVKNKREYTKVTFKPDLAKFHMEILDEDILCVLRRRVYDLCGTVRDCNIYLNEKKLPVKSFKGYVEMYVKAINERSPSLSIEQEANNYTSIVHEVINDRWEVAFAVSDGTFNQVSFVNSIATTAGGTHVKYVSDQIIDKLMDELNKKEKGKKKLMIKAPQIKSNMFIFINSLIENPAFTSQTKEQLTTRASQFATKQKDKVTITDQFIKKIMKTSIIDTIRSIVDANEDKALQKEDGRRKTRIKGQVKLVDANKAGTKEGCNCTLILTEGDSAKSLAVAGFSVVGRDYYGCFPLRGKLLNVRDASADQIAKNAEITALKKIIGLQHKKHYTIDNVKELRYGHVMIMTDQDHDGSHIKGLLINFFESSFPGLLSIPGFLLEFITPIVKVTIKGRGRQDLQKISFYSMPEFESWRDTEGQNVRWSHKYYKGLGTSTPAEAREYFSRLDSHLKEFHALQEQDPNLIELAFSKKKADDRKEWLQGFQPGTHLDSEMKVIPISNFINEELILFSMADNIRSIPSVLDGFKPGQRKVLFGCFKRNLVNEMKVAQLAGYIGEKTAYHHGEQSLMQTIIGLAQNFIGSNNMNLLKPNGGFGTRAAGGKDFSAARYIFTELNEITRKVFNPLDDPLYTYIQDDEQTVEPEWYLPVIPMLLVNGAEGIGTGWSTNIPSFNPVDLVNNIRRLMEGQELEELVPWYRGWEGEIEKIDAGRYKIKGLIEQMDAKTVEISEIPVKTWTDNVKNFLLEAIENDKTAWIKDMEEQHTSRIRFVVKLTEAEMAKTRKIGMLERFKLVSTVSMSNMVAFDSEGRIKKYDDPNQILRDFYFVRLLYYQKRKDHMTEALQNQLVKLSEQARFIKLIIDKELSVSNKKRTVLVELLRLLKFTRFDKKGQQIKDDDSCLFIEDAEKTLKEEEMGTGDMDLINEQGVNQIESEENVHVPENIYSHYDYLLGMSLWALTRERYEKLLEQRDEKEQELNILFNKSAKDLWNEDLDAFLESWQKFMDDDEFERSKLTSGPGLRASKKRRRVKADAKDDDYGAAKKKPVKKSSTATAISKKADTSKGNVKKAQGTLPFSKKDSAPPEDNLPTFFKKPPTNSSTDSKASEKSKRSFFDSDEDVVVLSEDDDAKKPSTSTAKSQGVPSVQDELDDLIIVNDKAPGRRKKEVSYAVDDFIETDEEEGEEEDKDDDSDVYTDGE
ncbi:DNA topoisomerase 2 [Metschnikowia bicuspidata var. bicuspidata NRRL YB-4993]|uniref:DNA topoisomerase 2 n=1 Tax=Metschnikowia bicuspidata var. bicuspidata NRRL YB-4993 TaxID=869754 RepID=A0A1A0H4T9_9ASCO|nr:DNA topoisomerase 2 [Metschnikowia bicuspidata var. bicuspidata NRRL YB-4993]OBA18965.1 DNA topoisomerase 2 [Metschnikowia bicuspidata var. bicuspidata NRRL YB-4993]